MRLKNLMLAVALGLAAMTEQALAQLPDSSTRIYTLVTGSELTEDCPMCDRVPTVAPMTGTFRLRFRSEDYLFTYYDLQDIAFHAGTNGGPQYSLSGSGAFDIGGEVAIVQNVFLDVTINNGAANISGLFVNTDHGLSVRWPNIQVTLFQTNGTAFQAFSMDVLAEPALQFRAIIPDYANKNVKLEWDSNGAQAQLERASLVQGPYSPISPITTNQTFTDIGALTNGAFFYRLRKY